MSIETPTKDPQITPLPSDSTKANDDLRFVAPINEPFQIMRDHWVCQDGDVVLVVEDEYEKKRIIVSSIIMRMASKVFTALLSSNFKEGVSFAESKRSSRDPVELVLEDDNPEALLRLCKILHHVRIISFDTMPAVSDVYELAVVADKYDCADAMEWYSGYTFSWWENESHWDGDNALYTSKKYQLIIATKLFDQSFWFRLFTSRLIRTWDPKYHVETLYRSILADHFTTAELNALVAQLVPARLKLTEGVLLLMGTAAFNTSITTKSLIEKMRHAGIYPLPSKMQRNTLATLCAGLQNLGLPVKDECHRKYWTSGTCEVKVSTTTESVKTIVEVVNAYCGGLCLDCVRNGDDPSPASASPGTSQEKDKKKLRRAECRAHPAEPQNLPEHNCSCYLYDH